MGMEETKAMKKGYIIFCTAILIIAGLAVSPVSAKFVPTITSNSFTTDSDPILLYKYSFVSYGVLENGARLKTPVIATKTYNIFTVTVPKEWEGQKIYYQVCTQDRPIKWQRMECEHPQRSVQLLEKKPTTETKKVYKPAYVMHYNRHKRMR